MIWKSIKSFWQFWGCRGWPHTKNCACLMLFYLKRPKAVVRPWLMLQKIFYGIWKVYTWVKKIWYYFISTSTNDLRTASENRSKTYGAPCRCQCFEAKVNQGMIFHYTWLICPVPKMLHNWMFKRYMVSGCWEKGTQIMNVWMLPQ